MSRDNAKRASFSDALGSWPAPPVHWRVQPDPPGPPNDRFHAFAFEFRKLCLRHGVTLSGGHVEVSDGSYSEDRLTLVDRTDKAELARLEHGVARDFRSRHVFRGVPLGRMARRGQRSYIRTCIAEIRRLRAKLGGALASPGDIHGQANDPSREEP